jgi:hypothetical protein
MNKDIYDLYNIIFIKNDIDHTHKNEIILYIKKSLDNNINKIDIIKKLLTYNITRRKKDIPIFI